MVVEVKVHEAVAKFICSGRSCDLCQATGINIVSDGLISLEGTRLLYLACSKCGKIYSIRQSSFPKALLLSLFDYTLLNKLLFESLQSNIHFSWGLSLR
jgi:hypothetical protein